MTMPTDTETCTETCTETLDIWPRLQSALALASARHKHLCPRQVLGARIGIAGAGALQMDVPRHDKRLLVIVETDGCFADGVEAATGATVGHRTLRVEDYGKIAATFVDLKTGRAVRLAPQIDVRARASIYAPQETRRYFAMLNGYQRMPDSELLSFDWVSLTTPVEAIISRAGARVNCEGCGEEIINERELVRNDRIVCRFCAGEGYYSVQ